MSELTFKPLDDLEKAKELVDVLLDEHRDLLPASLSARLSAYRTDLEAAIEGEYARCKCPAEF